jgi:hypothetical protein
MFTEAWEGVTALRSNRSAMRLLGADIMCSLLYGAQSVLLLLLGRRLGYAASVRNWSNKARYLAVRSRIKAEGRRRWMIPTRADAAGYAFTRSPDAADLSMAAMTAWWRTASAKSGTVWVPLSMSAANAA